MKIDKDALKKQVILHLPIFCSFWYSLSWARRCALPQGRTLHRIIGLSEGFALAFQSMWPGAALDWLVDYAALPLSVWRSISKERMRKNTAKM